MDRRLQELKKCFCGALIRAKWQEVWVDAKILFWSHLKSSESRRPRSSDSLVGWIYKKRFIAQTLVDSESESEVAQSLSRVGLFATPWTVAYQSPSTGFSRQEYWSGVPFPLQRIFLTQGSNLGLPHCRQMLYCLSHLDRLRSKH